MEGHTLSESTHRRSLERSDPQRQEIDGGARGWGRGGGVSLSCGQSFSLGDEKALKVVHSWVNMLHAAELCS